jgi:hypothetical protein
MVAGYWVNQDGLGLQYGTQKAIPELGGDYLFYGENREIEQYIPLVPTNWGSGNPAVAAPPTSLTFPVSANQTTPQSVGIQAYTTMMPLQITAPQSASGSALSLTNPQLFIERVELLCLQTVAPTTNTMTIGLVTTQSQTPVTSAPYIQITPNAGVQIIGATTPLTLNTAVGTTGDYTLFSVNTAPGAAFGGTAGTGGGVPIATTGNSGAWVGTNVPLVTNTNFDPTTSAQALPQEAWISTLTSGAFTAGLLKLRIKYFIYGNINY